MPRQQSRQSALTSAVLFDTPIATSNNHLLRFISHAEKEQTSDACYTVCTDYDGRTRSMVTVHIFWQVSDGRIDVTTVRHNFASNLLELDFCTVSIHTAIAMLRSTPSYANHFRISANVMSSTLAHMFKTQEKS